MIFNVVILLVVLAIVASGMPNKPTLTANIRDTNVDGLEGLNLKLVAPFKVQDYVVGFRYAVAGLKTLPESLFARKSFDVADTTVDVDADFTVANNVLKVGARWNSEQYGVTVTANADTESKFKDIGVSKRLDINGNRLTVSGVYDLLKKSARGTAVVDADATRVRLSFDSDNQDPELSVTRNIDDNNSVSPSIRLRSGKMTYGFARNWRGGSVAGRLHPGDKVTLEWRDDGAAGSWVTTADVPLANTKATKVSFTREWAY
mmetsp:Transcript_841/g.491  ORF Transcript_841/g.491 Transcript_841/m.491 type:complete len:261 (+) Transcript_841:74-856(+)|eukprot:CAMPEP_0202964842 /NCGR_PEP_ID=MMETSP1396-20130829/8949_1 /ASSEMBLY_ACC=CAM_ASM_000872 /TAXON_ID= /ORGANISM="Pseudokeronopsis sp., Strain Brazil" /LENGTH=260 /DNA_ID=CAMNT_0049687269 /DNA_START=56 /DNA_END=838 /DNA_ORIENTATION=-